MRLDMIAKRLDLKAREVLVYRLDFLKADDVRIALLQPGAEIFDTGADAVDVPGDNLHGVRFKQFMMRRYQMAKLVPQPQLATALGFLIWKDWPSRLSTKSISEPSI